MKVLVATDGSDDAIDGAREALSLLREGAKVVLAMVVPELVDPMETAGGFAGPLMTPEEATETFQDGIQSGEEALQASLKALADATAGMHDTVRTRLITSEFDAGTTLVDEAEKLDADLVVIGSSGKGFFHRLLSGSVSEHIIRNAPCPVLVIRSRDDDEG